MKGQRTPGEPRQNQYATIKVKNKGRKRRMMMAKTKRDRMLMSRRTELVIFTQSYEDRRVI